METNEKFEEMVYTKKNLEDLLKSEDSGAALSFLASQQKKFLGDSMLEIEALSYIVMCQGNIYIKLRDYESSLECLEESYRIHPDDSVLFLKAMTLWALGRLDDAALVIESIEDPMIFGHADSWFNRVNRVKGTES